MKKKTILIFILLTVFLVSCTIKAQPYSFEREGISKIEGTNKMSNPVNTKEFTGAAINVILNNIEALKPEKTGKRYEALEWQYRFVVQYENGKEISVFLSEDAISIDGELYSAKGYDKETFLRYFSE